MPKNRNSPRDAKVQPSDANRIEGPLISYSGTQPPGKPRPHSQSHPSTGTTVTTRPAGLSLDTTATTIYQPQPLPRGQPPKRNNVHSETGQPTRQYCPKHAPLYSNTTSNPRSKSPSGKKSPTTPTPSHNPPKPSKDGRLKAGTSHGHPTSTYSNADTGQADGRQENPDPPKVKRKGANGKVALTASPPGQKTNKPADDTTKKQAKRDRPEVTSIPQTNMSIGLLVFCCFNPLLGALAIYLSLTAAKAYRDGNDSKGATRAHWSILMSLFGIMITMVVVSSLVVFFAVNKPNSSNKYRTAGSLAQGL